jgi:D-tyrosyl-tRNA(Tyr) deacylase
VFSDPSDPEKMWKTNVKDIEGEILSVSQFTLMANTTRGNKPDFHGAMKASESQEMYNTFLAELRKLYKPDKIKDGKFGAMMDVSLTNEVRVLYAFLRGDHSIEQYPSQGPVTFTLDSRKFQYVDDLAVESSKIKSEGTPKEGKAEEVLSA